jgi:DNA-binding SARP family transcriptional activator
MSVLITIRVLGEPEIRIGATLILPTSPHLFALALYLSRAGERGVHKAELLDVLFATPGANGRKAHNLRQLLYRLRGLGAPIDAKSGCLRFTAFKVCTSIDEIASYTREARVTSYAADLTVLPNYNPNFSAQYRDWVETVRVQETARLRALLRHDFSDFVRECDWPNIVVVGEALKSLDPANEEVTAGIAEGLFMLGRRDEAIDAIDVFIAETELSVASRLRALRSRISRARHSAPVPQSTFHGRKDLLEALSAQWNVTVECGPQVALIVGQPGIGKTRLTQEFSSLLRMQGGQVLQYCATSTDRHRPLSLFRQLLPQLRSLRGSLGADPDLQLFLTRLTESDGTPPTMERASLEAMRGDLHRSLVDLVEAVVSERPLLLVVDDAHHVDAASQAVLDTLSDTPAGLQLMILYSGRTPSQQRLAYRERGFPVHSLPALSQKESAAVLGALMPNRQSDHVFITRCIERAAGVPYYLHVIARSEDDSVAAVVPFDIRSFASRAYHSLDESSKRVFESCVLLGSFATLERVRAVSALDGIPLLDSLRLLEVNGLIAFSDGNLRCAHDLLEEATRALFPTSVVGALSERVAQALEKDAAASGFPTALTSAAADSWLAAGNVTVAARLLQHCAEHAIHLGEPRAAFEVLARIPLDKLNVEARVSVLTQKADFAALSGTNDVLLGTLKELLDAHGSLGSDSVVLQDIELRIIDAELERAGYIHDSIARLWTVLRDETALPSQRTRAGIRLLIVADMMLDRGLAEDTLACLESVLTLLPPASDVRLRAQLVYRTAFGSQESALLTARALLSSHATPSLKQATVQARRNVAYALSRLGRYAEAQPIIFADYAFLVDRKVESEATYSALLLADNAISEGDVAQAAEWLERAEKVGTDGRATWHFHAAYYSIAASVALAKERSRDAIQLVDAAMNNCPVVRLPRYRATTLALTLQARLLSQDDFELRNDYAELRRLYELGADLGAQDVVVAALWRWLRSQSLAHEARELITSYICLRRRESTPPEAALREAINAEGIQIRVA